MPSRRAPSSGSRRADAPVGQAVGGPTERLRYTPTRVSENDPNQPSPEPELELARPVRAPSNPPSSPGPSNPRMRAVQSASRAQPLAAEAPQKMNRERLQEGAIDTILNSVSILGEVIEDFRSSDRFFKYKALVLGTWLLFTVGAFGVACPTTGPTNDIDARLVVSAEGSTPVYMVKNESSDVWEGVEITVNGQYRSTLAQLEAQGGNITLSPAVLFDDTGKRAPSSLIITEIVVHVLEPDATVVLLKGGSPQH